MKVSSKLRYAVRAMFDLAFHGEQEPLQIKDISERESIPQRFLEQIFKDLRRAELVTSKRGPHGGYQLARESHAIRLGDVLRAVEGAVQLNAPDESFGPGVDNGSVAVVDRTFRELSSSLEACFDAITLEDLCDRAQTDGVRRATGSGYVYMI